MTDGFDEGLAGLSEIAKQRRAAASAEAAEQQPDFIVEIDQSEVMHTFESKSLPFREMNIKDFIRSVETTYDTQLSPVDFAPLLRVISKDDLAALSPEEALHRLIKGGSGRLRFEGGRFPTTYDFVPIKIIRINFESIYVSVSGVSSIAEVVASELAELMWRCAGANKRWEEINRGRALTTFATGTRVMLPSDFRSMLSPSLIDFVETDTVAGKKYVARMGELSARYDFKPNSDVVAAFAVTEIKFRASRYDPQTGRAEDSRVEFSYLTRDDIGTRRVLVTSEMAFDDHVQFLQDLFAALPAD